MNFDRRTLALNFLFLAAFILQLFAANCHAQDQPKRVALVIGNSEYVNGALANPVNDADAMSSALEKVGFKVTKVKNRSKAEIEEDVDKATMDLAAGDLFLLFFAGHGMQLKNAN